MIGVTCGIDGWQADAYQTGLARVEACAIELGRRKCDFIVHSGVTLVVSQGKDYKDTKPDPRSRKTPHDVVTKGG